MKLNLFVVAAVIATLVSCQSKENNGAARSVSQKNSNPVLQQSGSSTQADSAKVYYDAATTSSDVAEKIKGFLVAKLKNDLPVMTNNDRQFSFYAIDLNGDDKNEYFVKLEGRYFCGSGGCSFYLLNNDLSVNTYFTVTNPPIFRSSQKTNGWNDLILFGDYDEKTGGVKSYIHLKFDKSKNRYPSNPSVIRKIEMAPSGSDYIMWSDDFSRAKTFTF